MIHNSSIKYSADFAKIEEPKIKEMMSFTQSVTNDKFQNLTLSGAAIRLKVQMCAFKIPAKGKTQSGSGSFEAVHCVFQSNHLSMI